MAQKTKPKNGIIDLYYWRNQLELYFSEKHTALKRFDCQLSAQIHDLTNEIRFYIDNLNPEDLSDLQAVKDEISRRFPGCYLIKYDGNNARNTKRPSTFPEYYICVTERAQKMVNSKITINDTFWAVAETKTMAIFLFLLFLLILLILLLQFHIKDSETL
jgi:hypothetical protein